MIQISKVKFLNLISLFLLIFGLNGVGLAKWSPSVEKISEEYADKLKVGKLDVDSNPIISSNFGIRSIPTLLIFKNGAPVDQIVGAVSKDVISSKVDNHI